MKASIAGSLWESHVGGSDSRRSAMEVIAGVPRALGSCGREPRALGASYQV